MKLELKHLIYQNYKPLMAYNKVHKKTDIITEIEFVHGLISFLNLGTVELKNIKPFLYPLSYLTKEQMDELRKLKFKDCIQWNKQHWNYIDEIKSFPTLQRYDVVQKLLEWHYDVFGLIPQNLAIDINQINQ